MPHRALRVVWPPLRHGYDQALAAEFVLMRKREAAASIASVFAGNGKRGGGGGLFAPKKPIFGFGMGKKAKKSKKPAAKVGNSKVSVNVVDVSVKSTTVSVGVRGKK